LAPKNEAKQPTQAELEILQTIWDLGPSTVRDVFVALNRQKETGYTTVLKIMQIMTEKGLLLCDKKVRPQVFSVAQSMQKTQRRLVKDLLDKAFSGSPGNLVLHALASKKTTPEERIKIRELLERLDEEEP